MRNGMVSSTAPCTFLTSQGTNGQETSDPIPFSIVIPDWKPGLKNWFENTLKQAPAPSLEQPRNSRGTGQVAHKVALQKIYTGLWELWGIYVSIWEIMKKSSTHIPS